MVAFTHIYLREENDAHFLFAPLAGLSMEVTNESAQVIKSIMTYGIGDAAEKTLIDWNDFLNDLEQTRPTSNASSNYMRSASGEIEFIPTQVTLSLTSGCNLRCVYCYIHGGDNYRLMPLSTAQAAIDLIAENAVRGGKNTITVAFHGEGEPT